MLSRKVFAMTVNGKHSFLRSICFVLLFIRASEGRVAGKVGYNNNYYSGKSYSGINDELIMVCIGMATTIAVLISLALCYIVREKCKKHREYYVTA